VDENGFPLLSRNVWDPVKNGGAGDILVNTRQEDRNILTYARGAQRIFLKDIIIDQDLDFGTGTTCGGDCDKLIKYVRGNDEYNTRPAEDDNGN